MIKTIQLDIIICPECSPKIKRFKRIKDLNIHLKLKHDSKYKIGIAENSTLRILGRKTH